MQKVMKGNNGNIVFVGQLCVKFFQCCVRMIGNELAHFFFVGGELEFRSAFVLSGSNATGFTPALEKIIDPRNTDAIFLGNFFAIPVHANKLLFF